MIEERFLKPLIDLAIKEDIGEGDITTESIFHEAKYVRANFLAKADGILAGIDVINYIVLNYIHELNFSSVKKDGDKLNKGEYFAFLEGDVRKILTFERTLLNFLQRMSGVATITNKFVQAIFHTNAKILDTRKTIPGWRYLDKLAVKIGGGQNHRIGLFDMFLIKDNHIAAAGGIKNAIQKCKEYSKNRGFNFKIEVEVKDLTELEVAISCGVDRVMLDNFSLEEIRQAVKIAKGKTEIEVSGGITLDNVKEIAETGVDFISIGFITHSAKAIDISLEIV